MTAVESGCVSPPHSCAVCESPQYKQAEEVFNRYGMRPENWGYMLHEILDDGKTEWKPHNYDFDLDEFATRG